MIVNNARIAQCQWFFMRRKPPSFFTERQSECERVFPRAR